MLRPWGQHVTGREDVFDWPFGQDRAAGHHNVGIRRKELHDTLGIPRLERGAEALQDLKQLCLRLHIRAHDEAVLALSEMSSKGAVA